MDPITQNHIRAHYYVKQDNDHQYFRLAVPSGVELISMVTMLQTHDHLATPLEVANLIRCPNGHLFKAWALRPFPFSFGIYITNYIYTS